MAGDVSNGTEGMGTNVNVSLDSRVYTAKQVGINTLMNLTVEISEIYREMCAIHPRIARNIYRVMCAMHPRIARNISGHVRNPS